MTCKMPERGQGRAHTTRGHCHQPGRARRAGPAPCGQDGETWVRSPLAGGDWAVMLFKKQAAPRGGHARLGAAQADGRTSKRSLDAVATRYQLRTCGRQGPGPAAALQRAASAGRLHASTQGPALRPCYPARHEHAPTHPQSHRRRRHRRLDDGPHRSRRSSPANCRWTVARPPRSC